MHWAVFAIVGYLAGSIPFGLLLARWAGLGDVRNIGSGNIGATNVLRTGNKKIAALTLLMDGVKGFAPVMLAQFLGGPGAAAVAGLAALLGHIFPVWLKFKGGKGVATGLGVLFGLNWILGLFFVAVWLVVFFAKRISSLAALSAIAASVVVAYFLERGAANPGKLWPLVLVIACIIWATHRTNILRLSKGEEPKSSFSKKP